jgi:hypothetical protein
MTVKVRQSGDPDDINHLVEHLRTEFEVAGGDRAYPNRGSFGPGLPRAAPGPAHPARPQRTRPAREAEPKRRAVTRTEQRERRRPAAVSLRSSSARARCGSGLGPLLQASATSPCRARSYESCYQSATFSPSRAASRTCSSMRCRRTACRKSGTPSVSGARRPVSCSRRSAYWWATL